MNRKNKRSATFRTAGEYAKAALIALAVAMVLRSVVVAAYVVSTESMTHTIEAGERLLVSKMTYGLKAPFTDITIVPLGLPARGDVIVFNPPQGDIPYVKRVIGLPGDRIEIVNKSVQVNGRPLDEPYIHFEDTVIFPQPVQPRDNLGPFVVPEGKLFVMGDNRDHSFDSRFWGFIDRSDVIGRVVAVLWSWDADRIAVRWSRLLTRIE